MPITFETVPDRGTNWVTILVYNALLNEERTRDAFQASTRRYHDPKIASDFLKKNIDISLDLWRTWPFPGRHREAFQNITQGLLHAIIVDVDWKNIYEAYQGKDVPLDIYEETVLLHIKEFTWKQGEVAPKDTITARKMLEAHMVTWCTVPQVRQHESALNTCMTTLLHEVWTHLDIPFLVEHLQEG